MTPDLDTLRLRAPDDLYAALLQAHDGLTESQSALLNAKLVLLLANQVGDADGGATLAACIAAARRDLT